MKVRLDKLLVDRGLAASPERAQALILAGRVLVREQKIDKSGSQIEADAAIRLLGDESRYMSRGGLKLEKAIVHWKIELAGRACADVGASTGGFTDCMLQHGAAQVLAIDTGYGQIDLRLREDPRVRLLERTNARYLTTGDLLGAGQGRIISFLAMDVSFISATLVLPAVVEAIRGNNRLAGMPGIALEAVVLVKPQFEAGRESIGEGGIVRDPEVRRAAVNKVSDTVRQLGGRSIEVTDSSILGAEGNKEFLLYCKFE
ncbi:MAG TPA: TlyA family RNA methyltransferase [Terriglobales bacterium]